jgi:glycerol kinase
MAATTGNKLQYCLEGSVFIAGAAVQWLRDGLGLFEKASESEILSLESDHNSDIVFIPALSGLGCPYWNSDFQGTILGLTRKTTKKEITRAALEGVAHQVADLLEAISANCANPLKILATDGGMTENKYFNDLLAKTTGVIIRTSTNSEMTSIGAGILAGIGSGFMKLDDYNSPIKQEGKTYSSNLTSEIRLNKRNRWKKAIRALEVFYKP